ncbi:MAG TPA: urease accessory protein UreD [Lapillicoccus sp.]|nr:urease accessory protein UreD [Lapillicoccus sp.]
MSHTELEVGPAAGRPRVTVRTDGPRGRGHLGVRVLDVGHDRVRVALVAEGALLVAGDDVSVGMRVGSGLRLEVVEPAGTVAFGMRGGSARWAAAADVADGGELVWRAEPFVVAAGAVVHRDVRVVLAGSGTALLREVLVLGRVREGGGVLDQRLRVLGPAGPLLAEDLHLDGARPRVGVLGAYRVVDSVSLLGRRAIGTTTPPGAHRLELDDAGTVLRHCGDQTHTSPLDEAWVGLAAAHRPTAVPA